MECKCASPTDEYHGWECSITEGACMFLYPDSKACAEKYGEGPDSEGYIDDDRLDDEEEIVIDNDEALAERIKEMREEINGYIKISAEIPKELFEEYNRTLGEFYSDLPKDEEESVD